MSTMSRCVSLVALAACLAGCPGPAPAHDEAASSSGAEGTPSPADAGAPDTTTAPVASVEELTETEPSAPEEDDPFVRREGDRLVLARPIAFAIERDRILPESAPVLDALAAYLARHPALGCVEIGGHTDARGIEARPLGQARAESVRDYLVMRGIETTRLRPVGYGDTQPLVPGTSEEARRANRRIELRLCDAAAPR